MPSEFRQPHRDFTGYLIHEAPVDEKTKKIREQFGVDEETGYQKSYHWRRLAQLPREYRPEVAFEKLSYHNEDEYISTKVFIGLTMTAFACVGHAWVQMRTAKPLWGRLYRVPLVAIPSTYATIFFLNKTMERNAMRHAIVVDYLKKHPERFETVYRPKVREVMFFYQPIR